MRQINFNKYFRPFNIVSIILIIISLGFLVFKGLNNGVSNMFTGGVTSTWISQAQLVCYVN